MYSKYKSKQYPTEGHFYLASLQSSLKLTLDQLDYNKLRN